jgi:protein O-mannosyl-transferase
MTTTRRAVVGIAALTCLAYLNSFAGDFVFDDVPEIALNPAMEQLFPPWEAMFRGQKAPARPLPYLSFAIDTNLWGRRPFGYHITNLVVHVVAALAFFDLARLTLLSPRLRDRWGSRAVPLALVIAALWAVHPLHTQAVTYIYQRIESMAGMFCLVSLWAFARAEAANWSWRWLGVSVAACAAAMASKENAVVLPLLVLLYDWLFSPTQNAQAWRADVWQRRHFYAAMASTWLILAAVMASQASEYQEFGTAKRSPLTYALTQPGVIMHYLRLSFWPIGQCLDYSGWTAVDAITPTQLPAYMAIAAIVMLTVFGTLHRHPAAWLGVFFLGTLAPTSSVMPVEAFVNEHRMYLPLAAVVAAVVLGMVEACRRLAPRCAGQPVDNEQRLMRTAWIAAVSVTILLVLLTHARNRLYFSAAAIWNDVLDHDPGNYRALWRFADMMDRNGDEASAFQLADRALDRKPSCDVYGALAAAHLSQGDYAGAEQRCRRGLERQRAALPADDRAVLSATGDLATALRLQGKVAEAENLCTAVIMDMRRVLGENDAITLSAEQLIAEGLAQRGDYVAAEAKARGALTRARKSKGDTNPIAINAAVALARVLDAAGKTGEAERLMKQTLDEVLRKGSRRPNDRLLLEDMWAEFLEKGEKFDDAMAIRRHIADMNEQLHGRESPLTAAALTKHALAVAAQATARGEHEKAASIYSRIYENYKAGLGADHTETQAMDAKWRRAMERVRQVDPSIQDQRD